MPSSNDPFTFIQASFAAGEIAPDLYGRVDQELYGIALRTCENFIVRQYGGVANKPGTHFTCEGVDSGARRLRVIPFSFNTQQTYVLALGHLTMTIIKDGAEVTEAPKSITAATNGNPVVITSPAHGYANGDKVFIDGVLGTRELNKRWFKIAGVTTDTFQLQDYQGNAINGSLYTAYVSGGTVARVYVVATPWAEDDLFELNYTQSADVLTIVHVNYVQRDVSRTSNTNWTVTPFISKEGPFKDINTDAAITVYGSGALVGASITLTANSTLFTAGDVGSLFYIEQRPDVTAPAWEAGKAGITNGSVIKAGANYYQAIGAGTTGTLKPTIVDGNEQDGTPGVNWQYLHSGFGIVQITGFTSGTSVTATVMKRLPDSVATSAGATSVWAKAAWSATEGYPGAVAYDKQRMIFGGTPGQPHALWMSGIGLRTYFGKNRPILDDDSLTITLDTRQINAIRHLFSLTELIAMTSGAEILITGQQNSSIVASESPLVKVQGYNGISFPPPLVVGSIGIFIQDKGSLVRSFAYAFDSDSFTGVDLTSRSPHLFRGHQIIDWAFQKVPFSCVWAIREDGVALCFTIQNENKLYAWSKHTTDGFYESVATISEGDEDVAYFVVRRIVNGVSRRYIERMVTRTFTDVADAYFVESGLSYDGRNLTGTTMTVSGGTAWDQTETLTLTAGASTFTAFDVGSEIQFTNGVSTYRLAITSVTNSTVAQGIPNRQLDIAHRNTAFSNWVFARKNFTGLHHLEGKTLSVLGDGNVLPQVTVSNGGVSLSVAAGRVHIGLPYASKFETLDIALGSGKVRGAVKSVPSVQLLVQESRGIFAGQTFDNLEEYKQSPDGYDQPIALLTDMIEMQIGSNWNTKGRVCVQQNDPLPLTILGILPKVIFGSD